MNCDSCRKKMSQGDTVNCETCWKSLEAFYLKAEKRIAALEEVVSELCQVGSDLTLRPRDDRRKLAVERFDNVSGKALELLNQNGGKLKMTFQFDYEKKIEQLQARIASLEAERNRLKEVIKELEAGLARAVQSLSSGRQAESEANGQVAKAVELLKRWESTELRHVSQMGEETRAFLASIGGEGKND